jgi:hypothetical protein
MIALFRNNDPEEAEAQYEATLKHVRSQTQREPTLEDKNESRRILGLPPLPEENSRDTPTE